MERLLPLCKRIAALLLLASLFLPLARCSYDTTEPAPGGGSDITVMHHSDRVPWREVDGSGEGPDHSGEGPDYSGEELDESDEHCQADPRSEGGSRQAGGYRGGPRGRSERVGHG